MLVYKCLLTIALTWQSSCITIKNIQNLFVHQNLFVQTCNLANFEADDVKKYMRENIEKTLCLL